MFYSLFTLKGERSLESDFPKEKFDPINSISSGNGFLQKKIPDYLLNFANKPNWTCVQLEEIIQNTFHRKVDNLYLDEILLKSDNPNLIFERVRQYLSPDGYFAFRIVTAENIKFKIQERFSSSIFNIYYPFHFLSRRVLPKLKGCRKICRLLTIPIDVSKAEIMGRLIYKGFNIIDLVETDYETVIITQPSSVSNPSISNPEPNEGFLFKMKRLGENGKGITVYKFRSMHPYAEYVQDYLHRKNGLEAGGKFKNDFRVSTGGRVLRKYWIDELPMLYNLLKGDIKLIGVRPISEHYFSLYPEHAQVIRKKYKPGLLPPFYADMPVTFTEIVQSEVTYLQAYAKAPFQTDLLYLRRILTNIIVKKVRSK
ncbi:sugar transferase [Larkinella punicea]|uniref:Sugar transferase n=1 Tax=Larkinella punicea TaxID=2315727 RepID=A0A368JLU2_9BACT|nr:sugar transferase [Larkinella punicea]RCR67634.1 sugar transferase [Larkinella punicea]